MKTQQKEENQKCIPVTFFLFALWDNTHHSSGWQWLADCKSLMLAGWGVGGAGEEGANLDCSCRRQEAISDVNAHDKPQSGSGQMTAALQVSGGRYRNKQIAPTDEISIDPPTHTHPTHPVFLQKKCLPVSTLLLLVQPVKEGQLRIFQTH